MLKGHNTFFTVIISNCGSFVIIGNQIILFTRTFSDFYISGM